MSSGGNEAGRGVVLVESRVWNEYSQLVEELTAELGQRFPVSLQNWCGIGRRPYPLPVWQVYLVRFQGMAAGVCGLYRREADPTEVCWIGWLGVRPAYRRRKIAWQAIAQLKTVAVSRGCARLRVHTDESNLAAVALYQSAGFRLLERVGGRSGQRSSDPEDLVFECELAAGESCHRPQREGLK